MDRPLTITEAKALLDAANARWDAANAEVNAAKLAVADARVALNLAKLAADAALPKGFIVTETWRRDCDVTKKDVVVHKRTAKTIIVRYPGRDDEITFRKSDDGKWMQYPRTRYHTVMFEFQTEEK